MILRGDQRSKLDVYALETLVKTMLAITLHDRPGDHALVVDLYSKSVENFQLSGTDEKTAAEGRDYMLQRGLEVIAAAAAWKPGTPDRA